jgi:O-acetyl-ADP-ribose deacetylase (regulator of RNase III)
MIQFKQEDIFKSNAMALVNTVNTVGVMGKGIAYQFKKAYPEMFKDYQSACSTSEVQIGKMWVWKNPSIFGTQYIINFPTKQDWRNDSRIEDVEKGLDDLVKVVKKLSISSIAIPPLGCGNGKLKWEIVKELIINAVSTLDDVSIEIYEPL